MKVEKREFQRHVGKYLGEGRWVVEVSDSGVEICQTTGGNVSDKVKEIVRRDLGDWVDRRIAKIELCELGVGEGEAWRMLEYGCGCRREGNKEECKTHGKRYKVKELADVRI